MDLVRPVEKGRESVFGQQPRTTHTHVGYAYMTIAYCILRRFYSFVLFYETGDGSFNRGGARYAEEDFRAITYSKTLFQLIRHL